MQKYLFKFYQSVKIFFSFTSSQKLPALFNQCSKNDFKFAIKRFTNHCYEKAPTVDFLILENERLTRF